MADVQAYALPRDAPLRLGERPRLESWNAAGAPDQLALNAYLDRAVALLDPMLAGKGELAVRLDVGLPDQVDLLDGRDLDNYLLPLVTRLQRRGRPPVSCWAIKAPRQHSWLRAETAVPSTLPSTCAVRVAVATTASASTTAYKQQIHQAVAHVDVLPEGPVMLQIAFAVGALRNWVNLWKPTIDALDPILGRAIADKPWNPRDGRITRLGLHCRREPVLGHAVHMVIFADTLRQG